VLASAACREPARQLNGDPGGDGARSLVEALALRFGEVGREPAFDALRPKLARGALVPSRVFDDAAAWPRQGREWRAAEFAGYRSASGYRIGVRPSASEPTSVGDYRGQLRLERIAGGRFEWTVREELAVGPVRPVELAAALDALFRGAEAADEANARAAVAAAFPRASAKLGLLLNLEALSLARDPHGVTSVKLSVRVAPASLSSAAPLYAEFLNKYLTPIKTRVAAADDTGAAWWTLEAERNLWTLRLRLQGGSLVPLEGDAARRIPELLSVTSDYATRMGRFRIAARGLLADVRLSRTPLEKGFVAQFRETPDWDLPFLVEPLLGGPLHYPFEGPGSEAGWAAHETATGTRFVRHYRARVRENFILRWLGGMTSRALSEFRAGAEREADRFHGECLLALGEDLATLLREPRAERDRDDEPRGAGPTAPNASTMPTLSHRTAGS